MSTKFEFIDWSDPAIEEAVDISQALVAHCIEHNLPKDLTICGVAIDGAHIAAAAFEEGRQHEQQRIRDILGL